MPKIPCEKKKAYKAKNGYRGSGKSNIPWVYSTDVCSASGQVHTMEGGPEGIIFLLRFSNEFILVQIAILLHTQK